MSADRRRRRKLERHRRKRQEKRRKLRAASQAAVSTTIVPAAPGVRMSEALEIIAQPLLHGLPPDCTETEMQGVMMLAAAAWNLLLFEPNDVKAQKLRAELPDDAGEIVEMLLERKRDLFPSDRRAVLDVRTVVTESGFYTQALSAY